MKVDRLEVITESPEGSGPRADVLLIHGVYHDAASWGPFHPYFAARGYRAHAMSLRGHGQSSGRETLGNGGFREYLQDVLSVMDGLDRPLILMGHSLGGMLIQKAIEERDLDAAVLISAPTPGTMRRAGFKLLRRFPRPMLRALLSLDLNHLYHDPTVARALFFNHRVPEPVILENLARQLNQQEPRKLFLEVSFLRFGPPRRPTPILVLGGKEDYTLDRGNFEEIARRYRTQPVIFESLPHDLMLADGWRAVADRILGWLEGLGL